MERSSTDFDQAVNDIMNIDDDFYRNHIFEEFPIEGVDVTVSQLLTINTQDLYATENKENCTNTSSGNTRSSGRFEKPVSYDDIKKKQRNTVPYNTTKNNNLSVNLWRESAENRNLQPETKQEPGYPIPVEIEKFSSYAEMDFWLHLFICEIKRKNGDFYPPATLQNIAAWLQRYLRNEKSMYVNFFKTDDPVFSEFRRTLDSRMRELTNEGIGVEVKSADAVTEEDEVSLWESGVFSTGTAKGLSNAVFFYNGKVFGLRGGDEQIGLQADLFIIGYDSANKRRFVKFIPRIRKNTQGGLKQSKKATNLMQPIIHYDQEEENRYSIYKIYETYLNLIPRHGNFFRKPLDGKNFSSGTIPQKCLKGYLKNMFIQAGIPLDYRNISNHSGRVTLCTKLFNERYSDKTVKNRSKHSSDAVQRYQREQISLQSKVCANLEPVLIGPVKSEAEVKSIKNSLDKCEVNSNTQEKKPETPVPFDGKGVCGTILPNKPPQLPISDDNDNVLTVCVPSNVKKVEILTKCGNKFVMML